MDAAQWHQGLGLGKPMEEMLMGGSGGNTNSNPNNNQLNPTTNPAAAGAQQQQRAASNNGGAGAPAAAAAGGAGGERRARPQKEKALNCPRCNSTNTKFCYYNNYSLQQPRYFCKTCRRYWTEGGSLRNVPVGGGSRKNKRSSAVSVSSAAASTSAAAGTIPVGVGGLSSKNPKLMHHEAADLNLAFPPHRHISSGGGRGGLQPPEFAAFPSLESSSVVCSNPNSSSRGALSAMELLRSTGCYVPLQHVQLGGMMPPEYAAGFAASLGDAFRMPPPQQSHQSLLGFSLDTHAGAGNGGGYSAGLQESAAGRLLFPFEDLKPTLNAAGGGGANNNAAAAAAADQYEHTKDQAAGGGHDTPAGFWSNSILGNGTTNGGAGPW